MALAMMMSGPNGDRAAAKSSPGLGKYCNDGGGRARVEQNFSGTSSKVFSLLSENAQ